jgi:hypothetical protein
MDVELIDKSGHDNLVPDALRRWEELITFRLLILVEYELDEVERVLLDDVLEAMKQDEDAVTNNHFFDMRGSEKNSSEGRHMKKLTKDE